ncbi:MAG: ABC transporter permease [Hominimerdicola sp.]
MQVFKTFMKVAMTKLPTMLMYTVIFFIINVMMINSYSKDDNLYESTQLKICIVNEDNTPASEALVDYIGKIHKIVDIETDKDTILDALYYGRVNYVLTIKEGYAEKLANGEKDNLFSNNTVPGVYATELIDSQLDNYINVVSSYITGGNSLDDAVSKAGTALSQEVSVTINTFSTFEGDGYSLGSYYFMRYLPYIFISIMVSAFCPVLLVMNKKEIRNRTNCSAITNSKQTFQTMLGLGILCLSVWLVFMIGHGILYSFDVNEKIMLAVLNSFVFLLISAGLTLFLSVFITSRNAVDIIANTIGLGMSFLCGIFVPQNLLGDGVLSAARFLPAYWYVKANDMLAGMSDETYDPSKFLLYVGIQALFALVFFSLTLLISRLKIRSKN